MNATVKPAGFRCGVVSIVGRPNVGKSTLLNAIVGEKVTIVSPVAQTTRNPVKGLYNDERGQIVFIDTPGLHANRDYLDKYMNKSALGTTVGADCIVHLVDTAEPVGREEKDIVERLAALKAPVILGLNKVDVSHGRCIPEYIRLWEEALGRPVQELSSFVLLPLSGMKGIHLKELVDTLFQFLPEGEALYPKDTVCDVPRRMAIADIIREKLFNLLRQELPHALAVIIDEMEPRSNKTVYLRALVLIEKESQKMIVIGKNGQVLKKIGTLARQELEEFLEKKVFLELYVKNKKNWRDNPALLQDMGYELA